MRYENSKPRTDVNYSNEHPLKEFTQLLAGVAALLVLIIFILNASVGYLSAKVPFSYEVRMAQQMDFLASDSNPERKVLQSLANRLTPLMDLPAGMTVTVHYADDTTVNAFATLGGNVLFFQGLLDELPSEQALAAVMAHEIAHIKLRHPVVAMGKGFALATLAGFVGGASASSSAEWLIGSSANVSLLSFSRAQERQADLAASKALYALYGDIGGAKQLFDTFSTLEQGQIDISAGVELFRSHPHSGERWLALQAHAIEHGWATSGSSSALPEILQGKD